MSNPMHLAAANGQCVAACPACEEFRGEYRLLESAYAGANRIIRELRAELDEANTIAAEQEAKIQSLDELAMTACNELDKAHDTLRKRELLLLEWQAAERRWVEEFRKLQDENNLLRKGQANSLFHWVVPDLRGSKE
jgi:chromosome segregation ATPase